MGGFVCPSRAATVIHPSVSHLRTRANTYEQHQPYMAYYTSQTGQHPVASGAYPYSTYSYTHPQTPGAYPYTAGAYPGTAVTGYGAAWPYSYSYYQHQPASSLTKPAATQSTVPAGTTTLPTSAQRTTFTAYNPTYSRDSTGTSAAAGSSSRAYKKQSNFKGLFAKERASIPALSRPTITPTFVPVRNLMFGFGDDRNPSNDTVNVMEEILVEYIADIVGIFGTFIHFISLQQPYLLSAKLLLLPRKSRVYQ